MGTSDAPAHNATGFNAFLSFSLFPFSQPKVPKGIVLGEVRIATLRSIYAANGHLLLLLLLARSLHIVPRFGA